MKPSEMTDTEIYEECKKIWVEKTGWGWTHEEFMSLLYLDPEEEVTLKCGEIITGAMVSYWCADWRSFAHGWICAYKHLGKACEDGGRRN